MSDTTPLKTGSIESAIIPGARLEMSKDLVARKNQDGTVIVMKLDDSAVFYKIDGIAAAVWSELGNKPTLSELLSKFSEQHPNHREQIGRDVTNLVTALLGKQLIDKT